MTAFPAGLDGFLPLAETGRELDLLSFPLLENLSVAARHLKGGLFERIFLSESQIY